MAGLMPAAPPEQAPQAAAPAQDTSWLDAGTEPATPEEQALYEQFVAKAMLMIYSPDHLPKFEAMLQEGPPVEALARTAAMVVLRVKSAAEKAGQGIDGEILLHAGAEIYEDLAEYATKLGTHDFMDDKAAFESGWLMALDEFRTLSEQMGMGDKEAAAAEFGQIVEADKSGALGGKMKELAGQSKSAPAEQAPAKTQPQRGAKPKE